MKKPAKPSPDFPLFPHGNGQWAKKEGGRTRYYGPWNDPDGALRRYLATTPEASNGRQQGVSEQESVPDCPPPVKVRKQKPAKPHPDFPLYAHASGRWAKKIRGVTRFFGPWEDPEGALERWLEQKDDLLAGREPRAKGDGLTVWELVNRFMESKENRVKTGELKQRTWEDYHLIGERIIDVFGKGRLVSDLQPADFEELRGAFTKGHGKKARGHGPTALSNDINRARVVFNYAYKQGLIDRPVLFGEGFKKPSRAVLRRERQKKCRLFKAKDIRAMLKIASPQLKAMVLLGINAGLGNNDCALLPLSALDLDDGWLTYPRPKTSIERRCRLWPETAKALREVVGQRPQPKDKTHADKVFLTRCREPWTPKGKRGDSPITKETVKLLKALKLHRPGLGFYALRHTFETVAGETADQIAVDFIMGHAPTANDMSAVYRERITNKRLYRIAKHVRRWLSRSKSSRAKQVLASASAGAEQSAGS